MFNVIRGKKINRWTIALTLRHGRTKLGIIITQRYNYIESVDVRYQPAVECFTTRTRNIRSDETVTARSRLHGIYWATASYRPAARAKRFARTDANVFSCLGSVGRQ